MLCNILTAGEHTGHYNVVCSLVHHTWPNLIESMSSFVLKLHEWLLTGRKLCLASAVGIEIMLMLELDSGTEEVDATISLIAILYGCCVPIVLEFTNKELHEYRVARDCYIEGIIHGGAINYTE